MRNMWDYEEGGLNTELEELERSDIGVVFSGSGEARKFLER